MRRRQVRKEVYDLGMLYPMLMHGLDAQMGLPSLQGPLFPLAGGITGFCTGMLIVWFRRIRPLTGGKPYFSPIYPFPFFTNLPSSFRLSVRSSDVFPQWASQTQPPRDGTSQVWKMR